MTTETKRTHLTEHAGQQILVFDWAGMHDTAEILAEIEAAKRLIRSQPPASVLTLTCVRHARMNRPEIVRALREATEANAPHVRAAAVVGMTPHQRIVYEAIMLFSGRRLHAFSEMHAAKEWLAQQAEHAPHE